jgi:arylsulfatase A-like enzyme
MKILGKTIFLVVFGFLLVSCVSEEKGNSILPYNVLFVAFDDLNDWTGAFAGHPQAITPNIDKLAEKGMVFTNAHCAGTMCNPSRVSVITGLRPTTTGVYTNNDTPFSIYKENQTLNKHFKENGYYVAGAGKILHKFYYEKEHWDEYIGKHSKGENWISNRELPESEEATKVSGNIAWGGYRSADSLTFDARSVAWVSERINRKHDKPFFLACGIFRPHIPWYNPQKYFEMHPKEAIELPLVKEGDLDDVPLQGKNIAYSITNFTDPNDLNNNHGNAEHELIKQRGLWQDAVQAYQASVSYADAQFGNLMKALEESPYADNTIVIVWSDHGWHLGEKEHWRKATLWNEVTRVPLIISVPGKESGGRSNQPVSLIDLYPTLIELCGLPEVEGLEGESLLPLLSDPRAKRANPAISSLGPDYHSVKDENYSYINYGDGQEELYDIDKDPHEWNNLAKNPAYAEIKTRLKEYIPSKGKEAIRGVYSE